MGHFKGRVSEVRLDAGGNVEVCIACPARAIPGAGQYLIASDPDDQELVLGTPIFAIEADKQGFWTSPLFQARWVPGTSLDLVGPLGHGFNLPRNIQRLGMVALGETISRLMPLFHHNKQTQASMTLFTDLKLPMLPAAMEIYPLVSLKEALDWPDFLVLDVPLDRLADLRSVLGILDGKAPPYPGQVLVTTPMPCAGIARCGACAVPTRKGWGLACEDGPVFDLNLLQW